MTQDQVLALLQGSGEEYLSGERISGELGISRAAVWKAIEGLRQEGYEIDSAPRRGYRLCREPDVLRAGELERGLEGCLLGRTVVCLEEVDSTNTEAKRRAMAGAEEGTVVVSGRQTGGRGRQGRVFQSPRGGLYLTALLRPRVLPAQAVDLTAWTAVAICDGIEAACGVRPGIKWPNDIILEGKKLCGILTEMEVEGETGALQWVVVGIGTNTHHSLEDFPEEVRPLAVSLTMAGYPVRRARLAVSQIRALDRMYRDFAAGEKERWLEQYRKDCVTLGREVYLLREGRREQALALDVDGRFGLVVRFPDGRTETVTSGEVSVRGLLGYV